MIKLNKNIILKDGIEKQKDKKKGRRNIKEINLY